MSDDALTPEQIARVNEMRGHGGDALSSDEIARVNEMRGHAIDFPREGGGGGREAPEQAKIGAGEAYGHGVADAAGMELADESFDAGARFADWLSGDDTKRVSRGSPLAQPRPMERTDYGQTWLDDSERAREDQAAAYYGGMATGIGGTAMAPMGPAAKGATLGKRLAPAAIGGAAAGGVTGFGASEADTVEGLAQDTLEGATVGAVAGPVVGEAARGGIRGYKGARQWQQGRGAAAAKALAERQDLSMGKELGDRARTMSDPNSAEGRAMRAQALQGADVDRQAGHAADVARELDEIQRGGEGIKQYTQRASDPDRLTAQQRRVVEDLDTSLRNTDKITAEANIADKAAAVEEAMVRGEVKWDTAAGDDIVEAITVDIPNTRSGPRYRADAGSLRVDPRENARLNGVDDALNRYRIEREAATSPRDHFAALDELKRDIQKESEAAFKGGRFGIGKKIEDEYAQPLREMLEDADRWGAEASSIQTRENLAWTEMLREPRETAFKLTREGAEVSARTGHRGTQEAKENPVFGRVERAGTPGYGQETRDMGRLAETRAGLNEALSQRRPEGDELRQLAAQSREASNRIDATIAERQADVDMARRAADIEAASAAARPSADISTPIGREAAEASRLAAQQSALTSAGGLQQPHVQAAQAAAERAANARRVAGLAAGEAGQAGRVKAMQQAPDPPMGLVQRTARSMPYISKGMEEFAPLPGPKAARESMDLARMEAQPDNEAAKGILRQRQAIARKAQDAAQPPPPATPDGDFARWLGGTAAGAGAAVGGRVSATDAVVANPDAFGKAGAVVASAAQQSPKDGAIAHSIAAQTDPEYQRGQREAREARKESEDE